jgi:hypothetical protein
MKKAALGAMMDAGEGWCDAQKKEEKFLVKFQKALVS